MQNKLTLEAPAKINLHLGVREGRDSRGYHGADSLMVALDLANTVEIEKAPELSFTCAPDAGIELEETSAWRAAVAMGRAFDRSVDYAISIHEEIPSEAGLGGASTNAAAVIRGLCTLWRIDAADARVAAVARSIGADAAFFLDPAPTFLVDRGDVPSERFALSDEELARVPLVLVRPQGAGVSTRDAYAAFDRDPVAPASADAICEALREGRVENVPTLLFNNLEPAAVSLMPELDGVHTWLMEQDGVRAAMVTGSGSCTFACCEDEVAADALVVLAEEKGGWWVRKTRMTTRFCER